MEATFFVCSRGDAIGVRSIDDLPVDPAGESLPLESTGVLSALARGLGGTAAGKLEPLRDATCQSFPVFEFADGASAALAEMDDDAIDELGESWLADPGWQGADVDLHEATTLLVEIRQALRDATPETALFVLLEEKAL